MRLSNIVVRPIVTEKSMALEPYGKYVFRVTMTSTKGAISSEISRIFGVDIVEITTMVMPGKKKRIPKTRRFTKTQKWKKAIVKLKEGQKIDLASK